MGLFNFGKKENNNVQQNNVIQQTAAGQPVGNTPTAAQYVAAGHQMRAAERWGEAMEFYRSAANTGDPEGLYWLGNCVLTGKGAQKDDLLACQLYALAARKKHPQATETLFKYLNAVIAENNKSGNYAAMSPYLKVGAEAGHIQSIFLYGYFLTVGAGNLAQNRQEGYKWLKLAADNGYEQAKDILNKYY